MIIKINQLSKIGDEFKCSELSFIFDALVLGVRDYAKKCGFRNSSVGLSGGIDSALVAAIATAALGNKMFLCINAFKMEFRTLKI